MCYYNQGEGEMLCIEDESGDIYYDEYEYAYSGTWPGRNDPSWQEVMYVGPITRGGWTVGETYNSAFTGNNTMVLIPWDDNSCFETGRECDTFRMHGNNSRNDASEGCIILPPNRTRIPYGEDIIVY
jgi:hypothetical protein